MEMTNSPKGTGNSLLANSDAPLTDAAPSFTQIVNTQTARDLVVALVADKGCSVVITPLEDLDDDAALGKPGETGYLADGGGAERFIYEKIGAPRAKIVVTKTEAGDGAATLIRVRGLA